MYMSALLRLELLAAAAVLQKHAWRPVGQSRFAEMLLSDD
jgi:hypothetical protein